MPCTGCSDALKPYKLIRFRSEKTPAPVFVDRSSVPSHPGEVRAAHTQRQTDLSGLVWIAAERTTEDSVQRNSNTNGYLRDFVFPFLFYQTR